MLQNTSALCYQLANEQASLLASPPSSLESVPSPARARFKTQTPGESNVTGLLKPERDVGRLSMERKMLIFFLSSFLSSFAPDSPYGFLFRFPFFLATSKKYNETV